MYFCIAPICFVFFSGRDFIVQFSKEFCGKGFLAIAVQWGAEKDVDDFMRWLPSGATMFGGDEKQVGVWGCSFGAYQAERLGLTKTYGLKAVISVSGAGKDEGQVKRLEVKH